MVKRGLHSPNCATLIMAYFISLLGLTQTEYRIIYVYFRVTQVPLSSPRGCILLHLYCLQYNLHYRYLYIIKLSATQCILWLTGIDNSCVAVSYSQQPPITTLTTICLVTLSCVNFTVTGLNLVDSVIRGKSLIMFKCLKYAVTITSTFFQYQREFINRPSF